MKVCETVMGAEDHVDTNALAPSAEQGMRILDISGSLLDQPYVAQIWVMNNAIFVWMGSNAEKARLGYDYSPC
jgi:hypothetical protein